MAKKLESNLKNMVLCLLLISLVMSAALGYVYLLTKGPIEKAIKDAEIAAIKVVVPEFDNDPVAEKIISNGLDIFPAKKNGELVGYAVKTYTDNGFSGRFTLMVGILTNSNMHQIAVLSHKETPGFGDKMKKPKFKDQFNGKNPNNYKLSVKKDGGDVDAITGSTITSRAFCDALLRAYKEYNVINKKDVSETKPIQLTDTMQNKGGNNE